MYMFHAVGNAPRYAAKQESHNLALVLYTIVMLMCMVQGAKPGYA